MNKTRNSNYTKGQNVVVLKQTQLVSLRQNIFSYSFSSSRI